MTIGSNWLEPRWVAASFAAFCPGPVAAPQVRAMVVDVINAPLAGGRVKVPRMACHSAAGVLASSRALAAAGCLRRLRPAGWASVLVSSGWDGRLCGQSTLEMPGTRVSAYPAR